MKTVIGTYTVGKLRFISLSDSHRGAIKLLRKAWYAHCEQTGACRSYFAADGCNVVDAQIGQAFRDYKLIVEEGDA